MKKLILYAFFVMICLSGCSQKQPETTSQNPAPESAVQETQEVQAVEVSTEEEIETEPLPTNAPFPEADPSSVTFDDGNFSFVQIINDDDVCAEGTLSVENVDGNFMLRFTDESTNESNLSDAVQKLRISVGELLNPDQLESVYSIGFDVYARAKSDLFLNDDGDYVRVPGWIGGGGGTVCADGNWYGFADFSSSGINEYDLERSDACHVEFKFLLAESGKKWDSTVEDANFLIMRWGMQNLSDLYLDNLTFYDVEGNPIPLNPSAPEASQETEETA